MPAKNKNKDKAQNKDQDQPSSNPIRDEFATLSANIALASANTAPEFYYYSFSIATLGLTRYVDSVKTFVEGGGGAFLGPLWNYLDALSSGIVGLSQVLDKSGYRKNVTKAKGYINILSTVQLAGLTLAEQGLQLTPGLLGGPAFAAAFGVSFLISLDECVRCARRLSSDVYWLRDSNAQLIKLTKQYEDLDREIIFMPKPVGRLGKFAETQKLARLKQLDGNIKKLKADIGVVTYNTDKVALAKITREAQKDLFNAMANSFYLGTAFAGMLLLCIPGLAPVGWAAVMAASAMYLILKHGVNATVAIHSAIKAYRTGTNQANTRSSASDHEYETTSFLKPKSAGGSVGG